MRNKEARNFFGITVQTRIAAHNFGAVDAPDVKKASASLQQATSWETMRNKIDWYVLCTLFVKIEMTHLSEPRINLLR